MRSGHLINDGLVGGYVGLNTEQVQEGGHPAAV